MPDIPTTESLAYLTTQTDITFANNGGGNTNVTDYQQSSNGFTMRVVHGRTGTPSSFVQSQQNIDFTVNAAVDYSLSGSYTSSGSFSQLQGYLYDFTLNTTVYGYSYSFNNYSPFGGILTLGAMDGGSVTGNLTGTLVAGHKYQSVGFDLIQGYSNPDAGATAFGSTTLALRDAATVAPLPCTALVGVVLLNSIGVAFGIRQKRFA